MDLKNDVLFHRNLPFRFAPFSGASRSFLGGVYQLLLVKLNRNLARPGHSKGSV